MAILPPSCPIAPRKVHEVRFELVPGFGNALLTGRQFLAVGLQGKPEPLDHAEHVASGRAAGPGAAFDRPCRSRLSRRASAENRMS